MLMRTLVIVTVAALFTLPRAPSVAMAQTPEDQAFGARVRPLLERYCVSCHRDGKSKGGVNLEAAKGPEAVAGDAKLWRRVLENVDGELMPPPDEPQPSDDDRAFLAGWIEATLTKAACEGPPKAGHVTIRRLNRVEYDNTIRDLVGLDFHPAADFPTDDVGFGFDNIGDVLALSPILLEKYLAAAEQVAERAIVTDRTDWGETRKFAPADLRRAGGERYGEEGRILASTGEIKVRSRVEKAGSYRLRIRAFGQQAGPDPVKMAIRHNDREIAQIEVRAEEARPGLYETRLNLEPGEARLAAAFLNDFYDATIADEAHRDRNLIVQSFELQGPIREDQAAIPAFQKTLIPREPGSRDARAWADRARDGLTPFVARAFRRPAERGEVDRLLALVEREREAGSSFPEAMRLAVTAVLVSPNFLFRVELDRGRPGPDGLAAPLGDYALASRLSYFLWSSMPDDELFRLAAKGELKAPATLAAQARRMIADPKSDALVENFALQWLQLRALDTHTPDPKAFPAFNDQLRADMVSETRAFARYVMREDRGILEFLDSDYTFLNERLAKLYGIDGVTGDEVRRVALSDGQRGGVLTQASVLTVTSNPGRTSPVKRGKWVLEQVLGTPPPPPPPNVPELSESTEAIASGSLRERFEKHRADPSCANCHARLDPLGFVFENYDAIGAWRIKDGSFPIDPSGSLPTGESFDGPRAFKTFLMGRKDQFTRSLTEKMLTYALGRGMGPEDACEVDRIAAELPAADYRFVALVERIVTSVPFRMTDTAESRP
jgi:mono/diheme cytochrome c family protein